MVLARQARLLGHLGNALSLGNVAQGGHQGKLPAGQVGFFKCGCKVNGGHLGVGLEHVNDDLIVANVARCAHAATMSGAGPRLARACFAAFGLDTLTVGLIPAVVAESLFVYRHFKQPLATH